jgi:epoxyqueuosine reductase
LRQNRAVDASATAWLLERARAHGFDLCGVAPAAEFPEQGFFREWLARGYAGEMRYLSDSRRQSLQSVLPGAKAVLVCALNYNAGHPHSTEACSAPAEDAPRGWVSRYAWGEDYHAVLGQKLEALLGDLRVRFPEPFEARAYVDTGPILERVAAKYAGLGWLGKNTCLINENLGSWLFLGVILTTLDLAPTLGPAEAPPPDLCGNCRLCLDACPTGAIVEPYVLDARRCVSYLTIELRGSIPEDLRAPMGRHVFGCDICQDVCPWNRSAPATSLPEFQPRVRSVPPGPEASGSEASSEESLFVPHLEWLASLTEGEFARLFRSSAVRRAKWRGLVRNACVALGNSASAGESGAPTYARIAALLGRLASSSDSVIAEHASWALRRLGA